MNSITSITPLNKKKSTYTEAQKRATYKWRLANKEKLSIWNEEYKQNFKDNSKRWLENNKVRENKRLRILIFNIYQYKRECKRMRDILTDDR